MKFKIISDLNKTPAFIWFLIKTTLLIMAFSFILLKPPPNLIRLIGFSLRVDFWPIIPITAIIIYLLFRTSGRVGELITFGTVMVLFMLPLVGIWATSHTQTSVISGLIQNNDARAYYIDALRLTTGEDFSFFSSRRPLFAGFLSVLLVLTNYNLMVTLAILSTITAVSCYLMAREIQRTNGTETAVFLLMMVFLYYRLHSGITMSENFGIAIGSLGFTILWRGTAEKKLWLVGFGIFSITIALNARAGAFFILPFLVIWAGRLFRENNFISWRAITITSLAIILGFSANLLLGRLIGQSQGIPFANFSYTLYSLAAGGKSWAYAGEVHPEILLLPEPEHTKKVFQLAFELMRENPLQTVQGAIFFWKAIFTNTLYNVFAFVAKENWHLNPIVKWGLYFLSVMGIFVWFKDRKSSLNTLIMICIIGIFLSVPFVPPTDSFRMRPYASSIAMINILPAIGFGYLTSKIKLSQLNRATILESSTNFTMYFTILLILITLIGPVVIRNTSSAPLITLQACKSNAEQVVILFTEGTYINVMKNTYDFTDWPPNYHAYLFQKNAHSLEDVNLISWVESIGHSNTILTSLDVISNKDILLVFPTELLPEKTTGYVQFCGQFEENLQVYSIFNASEVRYIPPN